MFGCDVVLNLHVIFELSSKVRKSQTFFAAAKLKGMGVGFEEGSPIFDLFLN